MKKRNQISQAIILAVIILMSSIQMSPAQNFEGVIHYEFAAMEERGMGAVAYMIKAPKMRMQIGMNGRKVAMLYLPEKSQMVVLIDKMKAYMRMDINQEAPDNKDTGKWEESAMEKTGITKTVAGHSCEIWKVTSDEGDTMTLCMAEGLGTFMMPSNPMAQNSAPDWAREIIREGYMPLEVIKNSNGNKEVMMKAVKIEEKALDASLFEIPEGYRDMSAMMQQMKNMQNQ